MDICKRMCKMIQQFIKSLKPNPKIKTNNQPQDLLSKQTIKKVETFMTMKGDGLKEQMDNRYRFRKKTLVIELMGILICKKVSKKQKLDFSKLPSLHRLDQKKSPIKKISLENLNGFEQNKTIKKTIRMSVSFEPSLMIEKVNGWIIFRLIHSIKRQA